MLFYSPGKGKMKNVFLLEDSDAMAAAVTHLLEHWSVSAAIIRAKRIDEAIQICSERRPLDFDLAILDYELPDGFGTTLMETIRRLVPDCRILVYSAALDVDPDVNRIILRQRPNFTLRKPFALGAFRQILIDTGLL